MRCFLFLQPGMLISKKKLQNMERLQPLSHLKGLCDKRQVKEKMRSQRKSFSFARKKEALTILQINPKRSEELETRCFKEWREFRSPTVVHRWERLYPTYSILISVSVEVRCFQKKGCDLIIW